MNDPTSMQSILESHNLIAKAGVQAGVEIERCRTLKRIQIMEEALEQALEFIEDYVDVVDGDYGEQKPNRAMSICTAINLALGRIP